jgi:hypothetical protein
MKFFPYKFAHIVIAGMAFMTILACQNVDTETIADDDFESVTFIPSTTRAGDNAFESGDRIGVYASTNAKGDILESGNYATNVKYAYSAGQFVQVGQGISIYKGDGVYALNYYAVYPYNENQSVNFTFTIDEDQSTHANYTKNDLMMGYNSATTIDTSVRLIFRHMLSQVVVNTEHAGLEGRNYTLYFLSDINKVVASLAKLTATRATTNTRPIDIAMCPDGLHHYKAILPPQRMNAKEVVTYVRIDGHTYLARLEKDVNLHSGKSAVFELCPKSESDEYVLRQINN